MSTLLPPVEVQAKAWLSSFNAAIAADEAANLTALFAPECHWRDVCGISWRFATVNGRDNVVGQLRAFSAQASARDFEINPAVLPVRANVMAGEDVIEVVFSFSAKTGPGVGVARLRPARAPGDLPQAWTFFTTQDIDQVAKAKAPAETAESHHRDFAEAGWLEARAQQLRYEGREPDVLIIGGGHAGLSAAVELNRLGYSALIVDKMKRIGDNWRLRYNGLKLHNKTPVNHMRYLPFPVTWPAYISKDKLANWLEDYVETMEIDFWTETSFDGADYDETSVSWNARITRVDGSERVLRPKHIVLATSVSGTPNIPAVPTIENFGGKVLHSSQFAAGSEWRDRGVLVIGTGTSAHDISQELEANGADVTMVQRSPTMVLNVDPAAQLYDKIYFTEGPPIEVRDLLNAGVPLNVTKKSHKIITDEVRRIDADLHQRLEKAGWKLEFGEDGTGWPLKFRTRGGGYYFNVGASDLIADGKIGLIQWSDIKTFTADGVEMKDGTVVKAEMVVLATGYKGFQDIVVHYFGKAVADCVGPIWGFNEDQELHNMWMRTRQPGLWFTGGAFSQCRIYSRYIALQIDAIEAGRLEKAAP